jgi:hypothetical protein
VDAEFVVSEEMWDIASICVIMIIASRTRWVLGLLPP